jgi:hypothetical protein
MTKRGTDNTMTKRRTDNTMTKRGTDNTMTKRGTDNTMTKRKRAKGQKTIYKTLHIKLSKTFVYIIISVLAFT